MTTPHPSATTRALDEREFDALLELLSLWLSSRVELDHALADTLTLEQIEGFIAPLLITGEFAHRPTPFVDQLEAARLEYVAFGQEAR